MRITGCSRAPAPPEECRERECLATASATLLVGADATTAKPICAGVVIAQSAKATWLLTAAHCGNNGRQPERHLFVRAACAWGRMSVASAFERHPLFRAGDPNSAYDLAVVSVPRIPCARPVKLGTVPPRVERSVLVSARTTWHLLRVASRTALRLQLHRADSTLCGGSSGSPVFFEGAAGVELVALVSGGKGDCRGPLVAARTDVLVSSPKPGAPGEMFGRDQTCAQCSEQRALGAGPCGNAANQCDRDVDCSRAVACLTECRSLDCERACLAEPLRSAPLRTLLRCTCATGYSAACEAHCK